MIVNGNCGVRTRSSHSLAVSLTWHYSWDFMHGNITEEMYDFVLKYIWGTVWAHTHTHMYTHTHTSFGLDNKNNCIVIVLKIKKKIILIMLMF